MEKKKNSLLIVDDEELNLKALTHILEQDYIVYTAASGINAVEIAKNHLPDLILLDILMPEMNGYETLEKIKSFESLKKIPVIFISGLNSDEDEEKGLSLDAIDYITKPFSPANVKLRVRKQIQIINQLNSIERLSMIDQLTNMPNRRGFDDRLVMEWKKAIREQTSISMLMMDLDRFKVVNDTYGHLQGDKILQAVALIFPKSFKRPGDFAARWGGEEFAVLLPNTPLEGAVDIAEKIRLDIENASMPSPAGIEIKITISIGVTSLIPSQDSSIDDFTLSADRALYAAKQAGRNKVIVSE